MDIWFSRLIVTFLTVFDGSLECTGGGQNGPGWRKALCKYNTWSSQGLCPGFPSSSSLSSLTPSLPTSFHPSLPSTIGVVLQCGPLVAASLSSSLENLIEI